MRILIDPGHGGKDSGAVGVGGALEKDITLNIAIALRDKLREQGHQVLLTRGKDTFLSPEERRRMINKLMPQVFISIHANASENPRATGVETIYRDENDFELAQVVHRYMLMATRLRDRGVKQDIGDLKRRLAVLSVDEDIRAVLVEIGFITNPEDLKVITDYQTIASALAEAIKEWG